MTLTNLTPAAAGILAVVIDDCRGLGDDDTVEQLYWALEHEAIATGENAERVAYHIVHDCNRTIETRDAYWCCTWARSGTDDRISVAIPKN